MTHKQPKRGRLWLTDRSCVRLWPCRPNQVWSYDFVMARRKWLGITFLAALLAIAPGYGSAQQLKDASPATQPQGPAVEGEAAGTAKSFTPAEKKAYEKKTAEELDAIQQKISELRIKATTGMPQKKRVLNLAANNLQMQQLAAARELTTLEKASESAWGPQKAKLDKAMAELKKAFETTAKPRK